MGKYEQIINWIFTKNYNQGDVIVSFNRNELVTASDELGLARIKNLGDIPYSFRFRRQLPEGIQSTAPEGAEWIIVGMGIGEYAFRLAAPGKNYTGMFTIFRQRCLTQPLRLCDIMRLEQMNKHCLPVPVIIA
ncbi:MAG: hypothetical protein M5U34_13315 [Chloroflexi bacterium]|nr:hypothetical protein [Chloroflexota bacterium]